jgi:NPCBM/NEW2 domain-containing protein
VTVTCKLIQGAERERMLNPAPPPPAPGAPASQPAAKPPAKPSAANESEQLPPLKNIFAAGPRVFLNELQEFGVKNGPWPVSKNGLVGDGAKPIRVDGKDAPHSLGMHPPDAPGFAAAKFRLGKHAALFRGAVALDDSATLVFHTAIFEVWGDGKKLWESNPLHKAKEMLPCKVDVSGVDVLELRVRSTQSHFGLHAVWIDPYVLQRADTPDN